MHWVKIKSFVPSSGTLLLIVLNDWTLSSRTLLPLSSIHVFTLNFSELCYASGKDSYSCLLPLVSTCDDVTTTSIIQSLKLNPNTAAVSTASWNGSRCRLLKSSAALSTPPPSSFLNLSLPTLVRHAKSLNFLTRESATKDNPRQKSFGPNSIIALSNVIP